MKKWSPTRLSSSQMEQDDLYLIHMGEANLNYMLAVNQRHCVPNASNKEIFFSV